VKSAGDLGELGERGLEVFDDLKLVRCPHSLDPTLVTLPSISLIPFAPFSGGDDIGVREIGAVFEAFVFQPEIVRRLSFRARVNPWKSESIMRIGVLPCAG